MVVPKGNCVYTVHMPRLNTVTYICVQLYAYCVQSQEEIKVEQRRKNVLALILHHLTEEGYALPLYQVINGEMFFCLVTWTPLNALKEKLVAISINMKYVIILTFPQFCR